MKSKAARRSLSLFLTYVVAILIIIAILLLMIPQLIESIKDLAERFDDYMESTADLINSIVDNFTSDEAIKDRFDGEWLKTTLLSFITSSGDILTAIGEYAKEYGMGLFVGVKNAVLGFFVSIYILISKESLHAQARRISAAIFKPQIRNRVLRYTRTANRTFGNFFIGKIIDSFIVGILVFIALLIFRIPYPLLISTFVALTDIIPVFGPFIGAIPSAFIIFIADPRKALIFVILILVIQQIDGNIIAPKILGESTGISSLGVIVAIVIMGDYFGLIGMIVGVPIFATVTIIVNELIETKLKSKDLPHAIEDYYPAYSLVNPRAEQQPKIAERLLKPLASKLQRKKNKNNADAKSEEAAKPSDEEKSEETNTED
jgi:predicted PurR-regulated permease PerM